MAGLAEFERDLIRERVKSGLAAARARGAKLGRQVGQHPSDKKVSKVLDLRREGLSYRIIARNLGMSPTTIQQIVRREMGASQHERSSTPGSTRGSVGGANASP